MNKNDITLVDILNRGPIKIKFVGNIHRLQTLVESIQVSTFPGQIQVCQHLYITDATSKTAVESGIVFQYIGNLVCYIEIRISGLYILERK